MDFSSAVVDGIPLVIIILGLVEFAKKFGLRGNGCIALSMSLGLIFGVLYRLQDGLPADFAGWFAIIIYGLGLGLVTSGLYDVVRGNNVH